MFPVTSMTTKRICATYVQKSSSISILIKLPLIVLWTLTVGVILWVVWQSGRSVWLRFLKPRLAQKAR